MVEVWAKLATWLVGSGEIPQLGVGQTLWAGLRGSYESIHEADESSMDAALLEGLDRGEPMYQVTGTRLGSAGRGILTRVPGGKFLLEPAAGATFDARPGALVAGDALSARVAIEVVPDYEWVDFQLADARQEWMVEEILLVKMPRPLIGECGMTITHEARLNWLADLYEGQYYLLRLRGVVE